MKDLRLTQTTTGLDIKMSNGAFEFAEDGTEVAQHAGIRVLKYKGESVTDNTTEDGTDWYGIIFKSDKSRAEKQFELTRRILETPGALKMIEPLIWSQSGGSVTISGSVQTEYGSETISETLEAL